MHAAVRDLYDQIWDRRPPEQARTERRAAQEAVYASSMPQVASPRRSREPVAASGGEPTQPVPVERIMEDLGVRSPDMLLRAAAVDQAGEQLILDAAAQSLEKPHSFYWPVARHWP